MRVKQTKSSELKARDKGLGQEKAHQTSFVKAVAKYRLKRGVKSTELEAMKLLKDDFLVDMKQSLLPKSENEDPNEATRSTDNVDS